MEHFDVAVIGAGGAGTMAHLRSVLNGNRTVLFSGDAESKRKGRATWVAEVDNVPGLHDLKRPITATTRSTLNWISKQSVLNDWHDEIKAVVVDVVNHSHTSGTKFELTYENKSGQHSVTASYVISATGIMDVQPHIGGSIQPILPFANRYDVLYCIRCDGHKTIGKKLSVIGNTGTAISMAAAMVERYGHENVAILAHGLKPDYSDSSLELAAAYGMQLHSSAITAIRGDAKGDGLEGYELEDGTFVETNSTFVALGIIPYNRLLLSVGAEVAENGRAIVNEKYESSVEGFYVVGDLVTGRKAQIYTAWDEAVDAADAIDSRLRLTKRELRLAEYRKQNATGLSGQAKE